MKPYPEVIIGNERLIATRAMIGPSHEDHLICEEHGYIRREWRLEAGKEVVVCYKCLIFNQVLGVVSRVGTPGERGFSIARTREGA